MPSENRIKVFKHRGKDVEELRKRRTDVTVELRKAKKDDQMLKRRNVSSFTAISPLKESNQQNQTVQLLPQERIVEKTLSIPSGSSSQLILMSKVPQSETDIFSAVQSVRKLLSRERNPPIDVVIKHGLVPKLINILQYSSNGDIQFEAAWAVTNVASGTSEQTKVVVDQGGVDVFIQLLSSPYLNVQEQAVWALGNIAGDGPSFRDFVIGKGILPPLLALVRGDIPHPFLRNVTWTLSNLCRNKNPPPPMEKIVVVLPYLAQLLHHTDKEVVADALWAISYLTDGPNDKIERVISDDVQPAIIPRLVQLLGCPEINIVTPALRAVGNIVTGTDEQTQRVVNCGALQFFESLLTHPRSNVVKEASWAISNITAGNQDQIEAVIQAGLLPAIINVLAQGEFKSQKEAIWIVTNFTSGGKAEQVAKLIETGVLGPLCDLLNKKDSKVTIVILEALNNILLNAQRLDVLEKVCILIEECGGLDKLELLQEHENEQIHKACYEIIDQFFSPESDEETGVEPQVNENDSVFSFGSATPSQHIHF